MASITFSGQLDQAMNEAAAEGNKILFIPQQTVGEVLPGAASELVVESDGTYSITLAYNTYSIYHYSDVTKRRTLLATDIVVSADTVVSTIPDLIGSTVPVTEDSVLTIQGYLTDAQNSATAAAASEAAVTNRVAAYEVETTEYLINSFDGSTLETGDVVRTLGYYTAGDGGGAEWVKTGETGTASQSPSDIGDASLTTVSGELFEISGLSVSYRALGAIEGVDCQPMIQAAWDSGKFVCELSGEFRFDSTLNMPSGLNALFTHNVIHKKNFSGDGITNSYFPSYDSDITLENFYLTHNSSSSTLRGYMWQMFVDNLTLINPKILNISEYDGSTGCWSLYLSGKNINILNPDIDATGAGLYGDGIHTAYIEDLTITGGKIYAGDDAIALFYPYMTSAEMGSDSPSKNISIIGTQVASVDANLVRVGASSSSDFSGDAGYNSYYQNVNIDVTLAEGYVSDISSSRSLTLNDMRDPSLLSGQHDNITIKISATHASTVAGEVGIVGNQDITDEANYNSRNYNNVTLILGDSYSEDIARYIYAGGVESLKIKDSNYNRGVQSTFNTVYSSCVGELVLDNVSMKTGDGGSSSTGVSIRYTESLIMKNGCDLQGDGEFYLINYQTNSTHDSSIYIDASCKIHGAGRILHNSNGSTVPYSIARVSCDMYDYTVSSVTPDAQNYSDGFIRLADGTVL